MKTLKQLSDEAEIDLLEAVLAERVARGTHELAVDHLHAEFGRCFPIRIAYLKSRNAEDDAR